MRTFLVHRVSIKSEAYYVDASSDDEAKGRLQKHLNGTGTKFDNVTRVASKDMDEYSHVQCDERHVK